MKDHLTLDDEFFDLPEAEAVAFLSDPAVDPDQLEEAALVYMNIYNEELLEFWDAMPLIKAIVSNPALHVDKASDIAKEWMIVANRFNPDHQAHAELLESLASNPAMGFAQLTASLSNSEPFGEVLVQAYPAIADVGLSYPLGGTMFETYEQAQASFVVLREAAERLGVTAELEALIKTYEATFTEDRRGRATGSNRFWGNTYLLIHGALGAETTTRLWATMIAILVRNKRIRDPNLLVDFPAPAFFRLVADYSLVPMPLP